MSPLSLRRYRAERLLRRDFEALRASVMANVRGRLSASGVSLDRGDLDACYAQAWQGLYTAVLDGQEIESPAGWLTLVTFRRAIEEHRARARAHRGGGDRAGSDGGARAGVELELETSVGGAAAERDLAAELDDRRRLRELFEAMRGRLDGREREAATLCYLQGLSRSEAAARLGVSDSRMRKLMEGNGDGRPGVAGKVGALVATIRDGGWCEEQGSLMRALAYGILDPDGERYRLALAHHAGCPSCRAYVVSLRGLAATLPPVFLPGGLGFAVLARGGAVHAGATAGSGAGLGGGVGHGAGSQAGRGIGGALPALGRRRRRWLGRRWRLAAGGWAARHEARRRMPACARCRGGLRRVGGRLRTHARTRRPPSVCACGRPRCGGGSALRGCTHARPRRCQPVGHASTLARSRRARQPRVRAGERVGGSGIPARYRQRPRG